MKVASIKLFHEKLIEVLSERYVELLNEEKAVTLDYINQNCVKGSERYHHLRTRVLEKAARISELRMLIQDDRLGIEDEVDDRIEELRA